MSKRTFEKTYEIVSGPSPEPFDTYATRVASGFATLLESTPNEATVQEFLEANPCMVPGLHSLGILPGAFPRSALLISQPSLPGLRERVPDFMWISWSSIAIYPTLIEI